jgi:predicted dehydrogenase
MSRYRVAIIGCGHRAPAHIEASRALEQAEVVACCDLDRDRAEAMAARYGLKAYGDAAEMIKAERPDAVNVVTLPATRVALLTLVAELGVRACVSEKPIATGVADWRALCALEAQSTTRFAVSHQFRWQPHLVACQQALASGALGEPLFVDMTAGMNIANQGTHSLNYGRSLIGEARVVSVFANAGGWDGDDASHPAPAMSAAYLTFANGVRGVWTSGAVSPRVGDPNTTWQHVRVAAHAQRGRVSYEEFGRWEIVGPDGAQGGHFGGFDAWGANNHAAQTGLQRAVFAWLDGSAPAPGTSLAESLHEWAAVLAIYQSTLDHRPVELAGFEPGDDLIEQYRAAIGGS